MWAERVIVDLIRIPGMPSSGAIKPTTSDASYGVKAVFAKNNASVITARNRLDKPTPGLGDDRGGMNGTEKVRIAFVGESSPNRKDAVVHTSTSSACAFTSDNLSSPEISLGSSVSRSWARIAIVSALVLMLLNAGATTREKAFHTALFEGAEILNAATESA
jgi:hypothetical protein